MILIIYNINLFDIVQSVDNDPFSWTLPISNHNKPKPSLTRGFTGVDFYNVHSFPLDSLTTLPRELKAIIFKLMGNVFFVI